MSKAKAKSTKAIPILPPQEDLLTDAKKHVQAEGFLMKRSLDTGKLMEALKHATNMIGQLRTSLLTPPNYYELYMVTFNELQHLHSYLVDELEKGERISKLYELVQYAGNILPRLYLLVLVGSVYIKSKEVPAKDVLRDMVEMCKGVQHPVRGLFLRHYLSEMTKDKLPDTGSPYYPQGGTTEDCIDFILQNFVEMNKLWVRMQHQSVISDKQQLEKERSDLRLLTGTNLSRLSKLEGVDEHLYTESVLPRLLEQIMVCKDKLAQQYLMECIIQVFPDEYHLKTLDSLLTTCGGLQEGVDIKSIIVCLIDRLANFASAAKDEGISNGKGDSTSVKSVFDSIDVFGFFYKNLATVIRERASLTIQDALQLIVALLNLSLQCYPDNLEHVDNILLFTAEYLGNIKNKDDILAPSASKQIVILLNKPLELKNIIAVLSLQHYPTVMGFLAYNTRKRVSIDIAKSSIQNLTRLSTAEHVNRLFEFISPIIRDQDDQPAVNDIDMEDFEEEQHLVGALVHLFVSSDLKELSAMYVTARKYFLTPGPTRDIRIKFTLPPLVFASLQLVIKMKDEELIAKKVLKFAHETITALSKAEFELGLKLFANAALTSDFCRFEEISYEFITQSLVIYENSITDSKHQFRCLQLLIGAVQQTRAFSQENYETLAAKLAQHSSRLLIKPDQCRAIYSVSHLFWTPTYKDGKRVLECLQKALKVADTCMETEMNLFIEILKEYLYYYLNNNESITVKYLNGLIALINTNMTNKEVDQNSEVHTHYKNTLQYIAHLRSSSHPRAAGLEEIEN